VEDALGLASRLAEVFPETGLWPVVWEWPTEEPDAYVNGPGNPARADRLDARRLLKHSFGGLAAPQAEARRMAVDPFGYVVEGSLFPQPPPGGWILMLVPVNRPADVYSVLRPEVTEYLGDHALTAILRSWEERFGVTIAALSPSSLGLAVGAPPRNREQARRLAGEHAAFAPEDDGTADLRELARRLRSTRIGRGEASARYWAFGWPD
jgi:hypothetical protein